ncbi:adenylate cyclase [Lebetimonas natsushimae]|uniref:Adenylate cyclase n=2 Tax=Lebetimonas natsushimae TaxID=1936991 RepID=A0A292YBP9_9BACT|nr:adenylate cyclase [Lebetimonas natsushimae]
MISVLIVFLYLLNPIILDSLNKKITDTFFYLKGNEPTSNLVTIVDIDEKSLSKFGQWPWERKIIAKIVKNLTKASVGIIGYDIFFPEHDRNKKNDYIFAKSLQNSPSILGLMFYFDKNITKNTLPNIPAIFIQRNFEKEFLPEAQGYLANIPGLQKSVYSSGFVNMVPDNDGIVRYVPLIIKYNDNFYPSLAFEMYRLSQGISKITINYTPVGIDNIHLDNNQTIKTDRFGRVFINYRGKRGKFNYISALDVYNNTFNKNLVKNKFVIIGTTSAGLFDLRATPYESVFPGVEIQATLLDNLLKNDILSKPENKEIINIAIILIVTILSAFIIYRFSAIKAITAIIILIALIYYGEYYLFRKHLIVLNTFYPLFSIVITSFVLTTINYFFEYKNSLLIKNAFAKKVSPNVMEELLQNPTDILAPKEKEITIYFSDIRSFTTISETLKDPKKVIEMLNEYFTPMANLIIKHEGTIDKFIGDAIMAYWNAPKNVLNHEDKAVSCAIKQIKFLKKINKKIYETFKVNIDIGIGINTGIATIGEMGSKGRADYTIIGDSVNLASRLEGLNKFYHSHIIISEFTKKKLKKDYTIRELDTVYVKGKNEPITIYEVIDFGKKDFNEYNKALYLYKNAKFKEAKKIFEKLYKHNKDYIYMLYIKRCEEYIKNPPKTFNGIYKFTTK